LKAYAESVRLLDTVASALSRDGIWPSPMNARAMRNGGSRARVALRQRIWEHTRAACRHYQQGLDALQSQPARSDQREVEAIRELSGNWPIAPVPESPLAFTVRLKADTTETSFTVA
jgi:hypothetical protein